MDHHEREMTLELRVGLRNGLCEVALVIALDQVGYDLGVRLGGERMAVIDEGVR